MDNEKNGKNKTSSTGCGLTVVILVALVIGAIVWSLGCDPRSAVQIGLAAGFGWVCCVMPCIIVILAAIMSLVRGFKP